jgi:hypothetical protein
VISNTSATLADTNIWIGNGSSVPTAHAISGDAIMSDTGVLTLATVPVTKGGTGLTSAAQGDLIYGSGVNTLSTLAKNTTASRYLSNSGTTNNPAWAQVDLTNGVTGVLPSANGGTGVNNGTKTVTLGGNLTTSGAFNTTLTTTGTTSVTLPTSGTLATTSQLPTPAALTSANDTNVTLTLGGTPSTALLQASSITAGWTGTLDVSRGGTSTGSAPTNGQLLIGNGTNYTLNTLSATNGIGITNGIGTSSIGVTVGSIGYIPITYLAVGGGGSGGSSQSGTISCTGGGGAGQIISSNQTITVSGGSYSLTCTVGAGGVGNSSTGSAGSSSTITGTSFTTVTAVGGGSGGIQNGSSNGQSGASGGGGSIITGTPSTGGSATAGNAGGSTSSFSGGAGGGGSGSAGGSPGANASGNGGTGTTNSITGSSVTYAAGGGGASYNGVAAGGTGGSSIGGNGSTNTTGNPGTANTGSGGGGIYSTGSAVKGGDGGSGVVIIRVPTVYYLSSTGSPTITTVGTDTVIKFTTTGTVSFTYNASGFSVGNNLNVSGVARIQNNTTPTSTTTGALIVDGGIGVGGAGYFGGNTNVSGYSAFFQSYTIQGFMTFTTGGGSYSNVVTYTDSLNTNSFSGTGVSGTVTQTRYDGLQGSTVAIRQRSNYLLSISGLGPNQILSALYIIQTGNSNTGINVTNIGTNGNYGNVTVSVVSNNGTFAGGGALSLGITIASSTSTASQGHFFYITFTCIGSS